MRVIWGLLLAASSIAAAADSHTVLPDIEFSHPAGVSVKMDAHIPTGAGPFPAVVLVHGGGWTAGDKNANFVRPLFGPLDQTGFAWFTIDYRLGPEHTYAEQVEDVEAAVEFVKKHAEEYKVAPKRIALMGESAGGHLVNLAGARNRVGIAAVVCFYGPIDMIAWSKRFDGKPLPKSVQGVFRIEALDEQGMEVMRRAAPATYLSKNTPPFLVIHGTKDEAVDYSQATLTVELFKKIGVPCDLITVRDGAHGVVNWEKEVRFQSYKAPMIEWLHKRLDVRP